MELGAVHLQDLHTHAITESAHNYAQFEMKKKKTLDKESPHTFTWISSPQPFAFKVFMETLF